jgi:diguanylate cyclase (GGDEF)-like protein/PAS domain S-box-containing protein
MVIRYRDRSSTLTVVGLSSLVFASLLFGAIGLFCKHQHNQYIEFVKELARGQMEVISFIAEEELQKGNYDSLPLLFKQWAGQYVDIDEIELVSKNGFMIASYGPLNPLDRRYVLDKVISYSYYGQANIMLAYSLEGVHEQSRDLWLQMLAAGLFITLLFVLLIYLFVTRRQETRLLSDTIEELRESESSNQHLVAYIQENPNPIASFDLLGKETFRNQAFTKLIKLLHTKNNNAILPKDHQVLMARIRSGERQLYAEVEVGYKHLLVLYQWIDLVEEVYVYIQDVTALRLAEQALKNERNLIQTTLTSIGDAVITTNNDEQIIYVNKASAQLIREDEHALLGKHFDKAFILLDRDLGRPIESPLSKCRRSKAGATVPLQARLVSADGSGLYVDITATRVVMGQEDTFGIVVVMRDVTWERRLQEELYHLASHDNLTNLMNRGAFESHLKQALESAHKREREHILCFMDLDQFKVVNDTCGHVAGDELLRQLAHVMHRHFRGSDVLARIGGDEFAAILTDCPIVNAQDRANRLREEVEKHYFRWEQHHFRVTLSIGMVPIDRHSESLSYLMNAADTARYCAKDAGRNRVSIYEHNSAFTKNWKGEMQWVSQINSAIEERRLTLFGQPIVSLASDELNTMAVEVLLRMKSPEGDLIPPGAFLPAAERYDLINQIDFWVLEQLMQLLCDYIDDYPDCFLNLSGATLGKNDASSYLKEIFARYQIQPQKLIFEITETAAVQNLSGALRMMHELREIGCRFALDDFGSGLSSFGYLKNLPIDFLKIDGMFVKDMHINPMDRGMVGAIKTVADTMHLTTIAEFVESQEVIDELRQTGIDYGQGYGIAKPQPIASLFPRNVGYNNVIWLNTE